MILKISSKEMWAEILPISYVLTFFDYIFEKI